MSVGRQPVSTRVTQLSVVWPDSHTGWWCPIWWTEIALAARWQREAASYSIHWLLITDEDRGYRGVGQ